MTESTTKKYQTIDAETGEILRESDSAPSVLMLKRLMQLLDAVARAETSYEKNVPIAYHQHTAKAKADLAEQVKKVRIYLSNNPAHD